MANTLQFPDDREASSHLHAVRTHAGVVRALLDEIERILPDSFAGRVVADQLIDELTRLGCRALETAASLSNGAVVPIPPASGPVPAGVVDSNNVKRFPVGR